MKEFLEAALEGKMASQAVLDTLSFKTYHMVPNWVWQTLWEYHVAELNVSTQPAEKKKLVRQKYKVTPIV